MLDNLAIQIDRVVKLDPSLTQSRLARKLGVNQSTVSRWARGLVNPVGEERERISRALNHLELTPKADSVVIGMKPAIDSKSVQALDRLVNKLSTVDKVAAELASVLYTLVQLANLTTHHDPISAREQVKELLQHSITRAERSEPLRSMRPLLAERLSLLDKASE